MRYLSGIVLGRLSRWASRCRVALSHTTIDNEVCAIDEAALVAGQEKHCLGLLDCLTKAACGEVNLAAVALLSIVTEPVLEERGTVIVSKKAIFRSEEGLLQWRRAQRVEPVSLPSMHHSQLSCQCQDSALACCVRQLRSRRTNKTNNTSGIDNASLFLSVLAEAQNCVLATEPYTLDVNCLSQVPDFLRCVDSVVIVGVHYASIVEDDVHTVPGVDVSDHGLNIGLLRDISDLGLNLAVLGFWDDLVEFGEGLLKCWARNVGEEDVSTLTCEENRCLKSDAAGQCQLRFAMSSFFAFKTAGQLQECRYRSRKIPVTYAVVAGTFYHVQHQLFCEFRRYTELSISSGALICGRDSCRKCRVFQIVRC